jgi:glycine/D-amino acid oxidase-like deaminating enzyme
MKADIAIIGAGVVGMTCALALLQAGRGVTLFDPAAPGSGCSYGNAGTIADYAVQPVGTPDVLRDLPRLMFDRNSPLAIRKAALPTLAPWLARFLRQSLPGRARENAQVLAGLLGDAGLRWAELAADCGAGDLLQDRGCLYLYADQKGINTAKAEMAYRRDLGVQVELLNRDELAAMEPGLPEMAGAAFFPGARFLSDPGAMMVALAARVRALGGVFVAERVDRLTPGNLPQLQARDTWQAQEIVVAAGAHSRAFAGMAGVRVPLDTERGYHLEWDMPRPRLTRPACITERGFYLCPMTGRLRVAGTVELGGLKAPPSPHRLARLEEGARAVFPDLGKASRTWMGFRPSIPDSLPVIERGENRVTLAFGHGHLGLTLAPVTAALVAGLISGKRPHLDLAPLSARRF